MSSKLLLLAPLLLVSLACRSIPVSQVRGHVFDAAGSPVHGAVIGSSAKLVWEPSTGNVEPEPELTTDAQGQFSGAVRTNMNGVSLMVVDRKSYHGAMLSSDDVDNRLLPIKLQPLISLRASFNPEKLQVWRRRPPFSETTVSLTDLSNEKLAAQWVMQFASFHVRLPAGEYALEIIGNFRWISRRVTLRSDARDQDLGTIILELPIIEERSGKPAPDWNITDARGVPNNAKPSDFKGKWVLIEFWTYWCKPCTGTSLPKLMEFYERHRADHSRFEIVAIHCTNDIGSIADLDKALERTIRVSWAGKKLPFPVLVDSSGRTLDSFGVSTFPTKVLIDPEGKLWGFGNEEILARKLEESRNR